MALGFPWKKKTGIEEGGEKMPARLRLYVSLGLSLGSQNNSRT